MGSVEMDTRKLLFLFFWEILSCSGQSDGSKSRFDDILSKFGFGGNAVPLEQQTLAPLVDLNTPLSSVKSVQFHKPLKKNNKKYDKKKFKDALEKFGFGKSASNAESSKTGSTFENQQTSVGSNPKTADHQTVRFSHSIQTDKKKHDKKNFKDALKKFGFGKFHLKVELPNPTVDAIHESDIKAKSNIPQFVKVVTNVLQNHQMYPRESKTETSQILVTSIPQFIREHTENKQKRPTHKEIKGKTIKKKSKKKISKTTDTKLEYNSGVPIVDPTFFVTPKSDVKKKSKLKKQHGRNKSKKQGPQNWPSSENIQSRNSHPTRNNQRFQVQNPNKNHQFIDKLEFSDASFITERPVPIRPKHPLVDFGEKQLST